MIPPLVALEFVVWQTVGLVQLKRFHRWFAVVFLCWWSVMLVWNATIVLRHPEAKSVSAIVFFAVRLAFYLSSGWYLPRRSLQEFSVPFVAEREKQRHTRLMQETAREKIQDYIRSMRG